MTVKRMRKIVRIDEERCDGCGLCVPSCAEGAIRIINGKARLVADNLCDGLGACLGHCPQDAITVEERPADEFDHAAVEQMQRSQPVAVALPVASPAPPPMPTPSGHAGCPGAMLRQLRRQPARDDASKPPAQGEQPSRLTHWPVQLSLVPTAGPIWQDADVLICADCVPFALAGFHDRLLTTLAGSPRTVAIACPKLDDVQAHAQKLATIFASNQIRSITVARMEVPCCGGIVRAVQAALQMSGRGDIPVSEVTVNIDGTIG